MCQAASPARSTFTSARFINQTGNAMGNPN